MMSLQVFLILPSLEVIMTLMERQFNVAVGGTIDVVFHLEDKIPQSLPNNHHSSMI